MIKTWKFTKKQLRQGYFDSNLKKFSEEMFQRTPPDIFDSCFNDPLMLRRINGTFQMDRFHFSLLPGKSEADLGLLQHPRWVTCDNS